MKVWLLRGQMLFQSSDYRKQGGTLLPCCESFRQEAGEKLKSSSSQKHSPWTSGLSIPLVDMQVLRLPQTEASAALGTGLSNLRLDRTPKWRKFDSHCHKPTADLQKDGLSGYHFLNSNFLNQVTFIQIRDTLKSGKLKMLEWVKQNQNFLKFHLGQ